MKTKVLFTLVLMLAGLTMVKAAEQDTIPDTKLKAYAMMEDSVQAVKEAETQRYNEMIKKSELMKGGKRYLEIKKVYGDSAKMEEIDVTAAEITVYDSIQEQYESIKESIKETKIALIKSDELGVSAYNKIKKGLRKDPDLKARYKKIVAALKEEEGEASQEEGKPEADKASAE